MSKFLKWTIVLTLAGLVSGIGSLVLIIDKAYTAPRTLARYVVRRAQGHNDIITSFAAYFADILNSRDRTYGIDKVPDFASIGAKQRQVLIGDALTKIAVSSPIEALQAFKNAKPGQAIIFLPGTYRFSGHAVVASTPGTESNRIVVRADIPGSVNIQFETQEGFAVSAPYWTFENLKVTGVCNVHDNCEHAFHVFGGAHHFIARNNVITDFNAHFKINGLNGEMPDFGVIENNTLSNTAVRKTIYPVTPIDLVAASGWNIRRNVIRDFVKGEGDRISYGAFVKGGGAGNRLEQNVVLCEVKLKGVPGQRVGLSLGGGGTERQFCRDRRCIVEQEHSVIRSNLIAYCSDEGIYINRAATSKIVHNTLIDTAGIEVRYPESTADIAGNIVDGVIRAVDDGLIRDGGNRNAALWNLYLGRHPERAMFIGAESLNLIWANEPERRHSVDEVPDLCQSIRPKSPTFGAFEDFAACF